MFVFQEHLKNEQLSLTPESPGRLTSFEQGTLSASGNNGTQLDTVSSPTSSQSWQLDALGNWSSVTSNGTTGTNGTTNRLFNAQNQTINATGLPEPGYDRNGNTTSDNGQILVYDAWNRLVAVEDGTNGDAPLASYSYDALGRRITETYTATGATNHLYYDSAGQVIEERQNGTAASNVSQQYVWSLAYVNAMVLRDNFTGVNPSRLYALQDANYDTVALVNTSGTVMERYDYTPYGTVTVLNPNGNPVSGNTSAFGWRYLFQGGRVDTVTGWYGFMNRDYIPAEGRWAERDPLGLEAGDPNLFRYEGSSPTDALDPSGLEKITLEYNAFIQGKPGVLLPDPSPFGGPFGWYVFTDERTFGEVGTSRQYVKVEIDTDTLGVNAQDPKCDPSHTVQKNIFTGQFGPVLEKTTIPDVVPNNPGYKYRHRRVAYAYNAFYASYDNIKGSYPFSAFAPNIDMGITYRVKKNYDGSVDITFRGYHNLFPYYEVVLQREDGSRQVLWKYDASRQYSGPGMVNLRLTNEFRSGIRLKDLKPTKPQNCIPRK